MPFNTDNENSDGRDTQPNTPLTHRRKQQLGLDSSITTPRLNRDESSIPSSSFQADFSNAAENQEGYELPKSSAYLIQNGLLQRELLPIDISKPRQMKVSCRM